MTFTHTDGDSFSATSTYDDNGLYRAQYIPTKSGDYTVNVKILNRAIPCVADDCLLYDIVGSPFNLVVRPGEISSLNSYTTV
jgi:hypothetical protein